jgi:acetyl esterase/lipase
MRISLISLAAVPLLLGLAACSPLGALNALSPRGDTELSAGLAYGPAARHRLDVYRPPQAQGQAPVVVFFYGGTWRKGERGDYAFVGRALASRGIVAVIADYRLYPEVSYPDFLDDGAMAVAWTRREIARYGGDPQRLYLMGHSSGAYNAAMLALDGRWLARQGLSPRMLSGWIGLAGPYDFLPIENPDVKPVFHHPDTPPDSQPIHHAHVGAPPALLIAARSDKLVEPPRNTGQLAGLLRAQQVPVQEHYYDSVSHVTLVVSLAAPARWLAPTLDDTVRFIQTPAATQPRAANR